MRIVNKSEKDKRWEKLAVAALCVVAAFCAFCAPAASAGGVDAVVAKAGGVDEALFDSLLRVKSELRNKVELRRAVVVLKNWLEASGVHCAERGSISSMNLYSDVFTEYFESNGLNKKGE